MSKKAWLVRFYIMIAPLILGAVGLGVWAAIQNDWVLEAVAFLSAIYAAAWALYFTVMILIERNKRAGKK